MFNSFKKVTRPSSRCKIDISLLDEDQDVLSKLKSPGNSFLVFKDSEVHHKKYGYIGIIPDKKYKRLNKLETYTYYWEVFSRYANETGNVDDDKLINKGFALKIY